MNLFFAGMIWQPKALWREPNGDLYINPVIAWGSIAFLLGVFVGLLL